MIARTEARAVANMMKALMPFDGKTLGRGLISLRAGWVRPDVYAVWMFSMANTHRYRGWAITLAYGAADRWVADRYYMGSTDWLAPLVDMVTDKPVILLSADRMKCFAKGGYVELVKERMQG